MKQKWEHHLDMSQSARTRKIVASDKDLLLLCGVCVGVES